MEQEPTAEAVAAYAAKMLARLAALAEEHPELAELQMLLESAMTEAVRLAGVVPVGA